MNDRTQYNESAGNDAYQDMQQQLDEMHAGMWGRN